ncbi:MAG: 2-keto-3-deoxygluconate permease [Ruminococcaceae bacterium]|nr:2-keto-3-deoxygluconate permease [Oscillospiraceae bacterium]
MNFMKKVPGGQIIVPMLLAMIINTAFPTFLGIGGPTTALFQKGTQTLMGLFLIICGSSIKIKEAGMPLYKGTLMLVMKLALGGGIGWLASYLFGAYGILGLTPFVLFCALPSNNSSLYVALSGEYGDATDMGAVSMLALKNGPFGSMLVMGMSGAAHIPVTDIIGTLIPILIGVIWGNLDENFRTLCSKSQPIVVIFQSFAIGASSSLLTLWDAGFSGILLGFISLALGLIIQFLYNLFLKKKSPLGVSMGTVAANSALTPSVIASADPTFQSMVPVAAAQCATASVVTMIICPFLVNFFNKRILKKQGAEQPLEAAAASK